MQPSLGSVFDLDAPDPFSSGINPSDLHDELGQMVVAAASPTPAAYQMLPTRITEAPSSPAASSPQWVPSDASEEEDNTLLYVGVAGAILIGGGLLVYSFTR